MTTVQTTSVTQSANETLGTKEKKLYYLIVQTEKGKLVINVGEKTHDEVKKLTEGEPIRPTALKPDGTLKTVEEMEADGTLKEAELKMQDARNRELAKKQGSK